MNEILFTFGATDTQVPAICINSTVNLRALGCRPMDISTSGNGAPAALSGGEVTFTVYRNGVSIGQIVTSGSTYVQSNITDALISQGDTLFIKASAAPGTDRNVCVTCIFG